MAKSYWLATDRINDPTGIMVYAATAEAYLKKCGAKIFIQNAHTNVREGNPGQLTNLIEFPTVRAAKAARKIIEEGGNALDAVIAAQNVLSVVEPQSSGLGGGGFLLHASFNS